MLISSVFLYFIGFSHISGIHIYSTYIFYTYILHIYSHIFFISYVPLFWFTYKRGTHISKIRLTNCNCLPFNILVDLISTHRILNLGKTQSSDSISTHWFFNKHDASWKTALIPVVDLVALFDSFDLFSFEADMGKTLKSFPLMIFSPSSVQISSYL